MCLKMSFLSGDPKQALLMWREKPQLHTSPSSLHRNSGYRFEIPDIFTAQYFPSIIGFASPWSHKVFGIIFLSTIGQIISVLYVSAYIVHTDFGVFNMIVTFLFPLPTGAYDKNTCTKRKIMICLNNRFWEIVMTINVNAKITNLREKRCVFSVNHVWWNVNLCNVVNTFCPR